MIESKLRNCNSSLDVNDIASDLPSSNIKTVNNFTQILRMSIKNPLDGVRKKKLDQYHDIDITHPFPAIVIKPTVLCRIRIQFAGRRLESRGEVVSIFACTLVCR